MHIVIAGGSGFVGRVLQERLLKEGHQVTVLTRNPGKVEQTEGVEAVEWLNPGSHPEKKLRSVDAIVNLAGESINGLRWTKQKKERIYKSRMDTAGEIIRIIQRMEVKPKVLVNASAVGYYGMSETTTFTEDYKSTADDFLAKTVKKWEEKAGAAEQLGVRTVFARFGIILGKGGALPLMALPYKLGIGGPIGSGRQWISWIHVEDAANMINFSIHTSAIEGPLNVTSPSPVKMDEFGRALGAALKRPHWLPVPEIALKIALGEMSLMLNSGQRALPAKAEYYRCTYLYPDLTSALEEIFEK